MTPRRFGIILGWILVVLAGTFAVAILIAMIRWAVTL